MITGISALIRHKEILKKLVVKNLKSKYAGSILGMLWVFITPLLLALVISFVFTEIIKVNIKNFYLFILSGLLPWFFFVNSLQEASISIPANVNMLRQFSLPRIFIPLAIVISNFIIMLLGFLIILPFFILSNPQLIFALPLFILTSFLHLCFSIGLSLFFSVIYVYFRDISHILNILLLFWLWLTPVFYSIDMIPAKYKFLFNLNPLTTYISLYRTSLFDATILSPLPILYSLFFSIISLCFGYIVFARKESSFLKWI